MHKRTLSALAVPVLVLLSVGARAEEKAEKPAPPVTPLRVQVVFNKYKGDKKVGSLPYTLAVNAGDRQATKLRMGIQVPVMLEGKDAPQYRNVGNNLDCRAEALDDGRFKLSLSLEQSSVYSEGDPKAPLRPPVFMSFNSEASLILRDGQTAQYTSATDPVSGEVLKIDVSLSVVR